jgi:predicted nucleic acid-binding protein
MNPRTVVLDAGALISFFIPEDQHHLVAKQGMVQLITMRTRMVTPTCVILEVAKRLLFDVNSKAMRTATEVMLETLEIVDTTQPVIQAALDLIQTQDHRTMTLEDAIVANTALLMRSKIWTHNYRDFASIKTLEFWNPA